MNRNRRPPNAKRRVSFAPPETLQAISAVIQQRQFSAAKAELDRLRASFPKDPNIANLSGVVLVELGQHEDALLSFRTAASLDSKNPLIAFNKGKTEFGLGQYSPAVASFKRAVKLNPKFADAYGFLGDTYRQLEKGKLAQDAYEKAIALNDSLLFARHGLGLVALSRGETGTAIDQFRTLLNALPDQDTASRAIAHANLGLALDQNGQRQDALGHMAAAYALDPENADVRRALVQNLRHVKELPDDIDFHTVLLRLLGSDDVNPRTLATAIQSVLRKRHELSPLLNVLDLAPEAPLDLTPDQRQTVTSLLQDQLFLAYLENCPITDYEIETLITHIRKDAILASMTGKKPHWAAPFEFVCALAHQCFVNEYVFYETDDETAQASHCVSDLENLTKADWNDDAFYRQALAACYRPLHTLTIDRPATDAVPEALQGLFRQQIDEVAMERDIAEGIPAIGTTMDSVSSSVQEQYTENPYPRWTRFDLTTPQPLATVLKSELPHLKDSELPAIKGPSILIAGCGTGLQTIKVVHKYENASVTAIDLSKASLAYGMRKLKEYGITSVKHAQANILDLGELDEKFDVVESYGVIHHMEDPAKALSILSGRLKPKGHLYLGLYSELGRQSVVEARRLIEETGYKDDARGIRQARRDIMRRTDEAFRPLLSPASDFWTLSDTRDLIFHVQEHRFTLLEVGNMLHDCGLDFLGLVVVSSTDRKLFQETFSDANAARSIDNWHEFEQSHPLVFGDTYKIWARKR